MDSKVARWHNLIPSFPSLDCAPTPSTLAQSKKRKGSNFVIWQPTLFGERRLFLLFLFYHSHSFEYHVAELVVVDHAVVVEVCVGQHLLDLLVGQLFVGEVHHALLELGLADEAVTVGVKDAKRVLDLGPNSIEKI